MHPWHPRVVSADEPAQAHWPAALWHRLLVDSRVPFGGRVLVVGCRHPELVAALAGCSFDVEGLDDRPATVEFARRSSPRLQFSFASFREPLPVPAHAFDLVLVHEVNLSSRDLLDASARLATANLLACLKPRGQLFFVRRMCGESETHTGHQRDCWAKHLTGFPGTTETSLLYDGWFSRGTWDWLRGRAGRGAHLIVRHEAPLELLTRESWMRSARRGQFVGRGPCCDCGAASSPQPALRRAA